MARGHNRWGNTKIQPTTGDIRGYPRTTSGDSEYSGNSEGFQKFRGIPGDSGGFRGIPGGVVNSREKLLGLGLYVKRRAKKKWPHDRVARRSNVKIRGSLRGLT